MHAISCYWGCDHAVCRQCSVSRSFWCSHMLPKLCDHAVIKWCIVEKLERIILMLEGLQIGAQFPAHALRDMEIWYMSTVFYSHIARKWVSKQLFFPQCFSTFFWAFKTGWFLPELHERCQHRWTAGWRTANLLRSFCWLQQNRLVSTIYLYLSLSTDDIYDIYDIYVIMIFLMHSIWRKSTCHGHSL